jgi:hypothetical protein
MSFDTWLRKGGAAMLEKLLNHSKKASLFT